MRPMYRYAWRYTYVSALVAFLELPAELAFLGIVANPPLDQLIPILSVIAPAIIVIWAVTVALSLWVARPTWRFLKARERHEIPPIDALQATQRHLANFPLQVGGIIVGAMVCTISIVAIVLKQRLGLSWHDFGIGVAGGSLGAVINFPIAAFATNMIFSPISREINYLLPEELQGGRTGWPFGIRTKLFLAVATLILAVAVFMSLVGYLVFVRILENTAAVALDISVLDFLAPVFPDASLVGRLLIAFIMINGTILAAALFVSFLIARELNSAIGAVTQTAARIQQGDHGATVPLTTNDELGELAAGFNSMSLNLAVRTSELEQLMIRIHDAVGRIRAAAESLAGIVAEQTAGAAEQAASVRELSATSDQIVETARAIADTTTHSGDILDDISTSSDEGRGELTQALDGISHVRSRVDAIGNSLVAVGEESQRAGDIINIIDDLAERSNLLALNAAIEARAAGEAGTRFQVVASEVRRLAENSKEATARIKAIIEGIQASTASSIMQTEEGMKASVSGEARVQQVGTRLQSILNAMEDLADRSRSVFGGAQEQKTSLEQISGTLNHLSTAADQIAKGYAETEQLIRDLGNLAEHLESMVSDV